MSPSSLPKTLFEQFHEAHNIIHGGIFGPYDGVRPWWWTESSCRFDRLPGVLILELHEAEVSERQVQPS